MLSASGEPDTKNGGNWNFYVKDSIALMSAHTIMSTQDCMKGGPWLYFRLAGLFFRLSL
jgi:hypothetical protein